MRLEINNFKKHLLVWTSVGGLLFLTACSTCRPVLYPNAHYNKVGQEKALKDIQAAIDMAKKNGLNDSSNSNKTLAKSGSKAAVSTTINAAAGVASGSLGTGTAIGAAGSGLSFLIDWMFVKKNPEPLFRKHVEMTLNQQGYQVLGWK